MALPLSSSPSYRDRYLPAMTLRQIADLADKSWAPVVIATGAIEQHGPHLPVAVDALMAETWLTLALARLPRDASCYVAPAITIGKSNEHTGFAGTLMISKETLRDLLLAIADQIRAWGFRQIAILNTHGGNTAVVTTTLREIRSSLGLRATLLNPAAELDISKQEAKYGMHAGEVETSWMMAVAGHLVRPGEAGCEYPARLEDPGELRPERSAATYAWATRDISKSGIIGDATAATREKGDRWLELIANGYAKAIAELGWAGKNLPVGAAPTKAARR
jgi:creatinine amidohydrolase